MICSDQDLDQEYFEIHEFGSKDSYIFKVIIFIFELIVSNFLSQTYSLFLADSKRKVSLKVLYHVQLVINKFTSQL